MITYIHSDDIGATQKVTERILASWLDGSLDGFSIIANGAAAEFLSSELGNAPGRPARIAVHLNLSEGRSSALPDRVPLLVDQHGTLKHTFGTLTLLWITSSAAVRRQFREQVTAEWRAQIETVRQLVAPRPVDVIDSHMHIHMLPFLFGISARLAQETRVPSIRISREPFYWCGGIRNGFRLFYWLNVVKHLVLRACALAAEPAARRLGLDFPDRLIGVLYTGRMTADRALAGLAAAQRQGIRSAEVVFHVGRADVDEGARWAGRDFLTDFYCSSLRDAEQLEAAELRRRLDMDSGRLRTD